MQKRHTLIISDYDTKTHTFHYMFSCPGYEETENAPCSLATRCEKCDEKLESENEDTCIRHNQEHRYINGEWQVQDRNVCAIRDCPGAADDSDIEEIALSYGNGTYAVDVSVNPYLQPDTWDIDFVSRIE